MSSTSSVFPDDLLSSSEMELIDKWKAFLEKRLQDAYNKLSQEFERQRAVISKALSNINDAALEVQFQDLENKMYKKLCKRWNLNREINNNLCVDYGDDDVSIKKINDAIHAWVR